MKYFAVFCVVLLAVVVTAQSDDLREEYCKVIPPKFQGKCLGITCNKENTRWHAEGCVVWKCGKPLSYKQEDLSKPFPDCCGGPVCREY